jgi:hypothetical protein
LLLAAGEMWVRKMAEKACDTKHILRCRKKNILTPGVDFFFFIFILLATKLTVVDVIPV